MIAAETRRSDVLSSQKVHACFAAAFRTQASPSFCCQLQKFKDFVNVCALQSVVEDEEQQKITIPKYVKNCSLLFAHSEVFVNNTTEAKVLKERNLREECEQ